MHFENEKLDSIEADKEFRLLRSMWHRTKAEYQRKYSVGISA